MVINNNYYNRISGVQGSPNIAPKQQTTAVKGDFGRILSETMQRNGEVKFSKHAEMRLKTRNIELSSAQMDKLAEAVDKAEKKGVRDTLVLLDNIAFVVNVRNRTVITAASSSELKENVFTNIDGAVVI